MAVPLPPQLNASDDRGIGIVRGQVLSFASTRTIFRSGFKLVILDEADAMTNDAQNALRRGNLGTVIQDGLSKCISASAASTGHVLSQEHEPSKAVKRQINLPSSQPSF